MKGLPIGYDNFGKIMEMDFVDKSLLIKDFIDNGTIEISLITRPRRNPETKSDVYCVGAI